jgi:hypothetical protein
VGLPELSEARLVGALSESAQKALLDNDGRGLLASHPSLRGAQAALERARLAGRRARLEPYPDVRVAVAGGRLGETDQSIVEVGIALPLPLLDRGKGRQAEGGANVRMAEEELRRVRLELQRQMGRRAEPLPGGGGAGGRVSGSARCRKRRKPCAWCRPVSRRASLSSLTRPIRRRVAAETRLAYHEALLELNLAQVELEALLEPQTPEPPAVP